MKVKFYIRKGKENSLQSHVEASFSWSGNRVRITTKESVLIKNWKPRKDNYVTQAQEFAHHINQRLNNIKSWAGDLIYEFKNKGEYLSKDEFKKRFIEKFHLNKTEETTPEKTILERFKDAAELKKATGGKRTGQAYQTLIKHFTEYLSDKDMLHTYEINQLVCEGFISYMVSKDKANRTINGYAILLKSLINASGMKSFKYLALQEKEGKNVVYSSDQIKEISKHFNKHNPYLLKYVQFIYYSFARPKELRFIQIKHVDLENKTIHITADIGKTTSHRVIEILPPFEALIRSMNLDEYPKDYYVFGLAGPSIRPVSYNYFNRKYRSELDKLKYSRDYTAYSWKHTGVTHHFLNGFDLRWLQDQCGHKDINMTLKYLRSMGLKITRAGIDKIAPKI